MFGNQLVSCDVYQQIAFLEMLCGDSRLRKWFKGTHSRCGDRTNGDEDTSREFVLVKVVGELTEMLNADGRLRTELYPDCSCSCLRIGNSFGRKWSMEDVHFFSRGGSDAHKSSTISCCQ